VSPRPSWRPIRPSTRRLSQCTNARAASASSPQTRRARYEPAAAQSNDWWRSSNSLRYACASGSAPSARLARRCPKRRSTNPAGRCHRYPSVRVEAYHTSATSSTSAVLPTCLFGYISVFQEPPRMVLRGNVRFQAGDGLLTDWCCPDFDCIDHSVAKSMGKRCARPCPSGVGCLPSNLGMNPSIPRSERFSTAAQESQSGFSDLGKGSAASSDRNIARIADPTGFCGAPDLVL